MLAAGCAFAAPSLRHTGLVAQRLGRHALAVLAAEVAHAGRLLALRMGEQIADGAELGAGLLELGGGAGVGVHEPDVVGDFGHARDRPEPAAVAALLHRKPVLALHDGAGALVLRHGLEQRE